jgi:hypothetical protein
MIMQWVTTGVAPYHGELATRSLPIALLPRLVRVEAAVRGALRVEVALRALSLRLMLLALGTLRACAASAREALAAVEPALGLLHAAAALLLASLANTCADVLGVAAVRLVRRLGRAAGALAERRSGGRARALAEAHEALHALAAAAVQLLAVVVRREAAHTLAVAVLVVDVTVWARGVLLAVETLAVRRLGLNRARCLLAGR